MIPIAVPNLSGKEAEYLQDCIDSTYVSSVGPYVDRFEELVAKASGAPTAVATSAGTTGLHVALLAVGVKPDDLVIIPSLTFIATANSVSHCNAEPWIFDVDKDSWTLSPEMVAATLETSTTMTADGLCIHRETGKTVKAIMPVCIMGAPLDFKEFRTIADRFNLKIVTDAAAAVGMTYRGKPLAQAGSDLCVCSFNGNKIVTAGGGGAVVGMDEALLQHVRHLSTTARVGADYDHDEIGYNYRMTNLQAAVGTAQMERLDEFLEIKARISSRYNAALAEISELCPFPEVSHSKSTFWFSGAWLSTGTPEQAKQIREYMNTHDVNVRAFWKPIHMQLPYQNSLKTDQLVSEDIWWRILVLPCSTHLTEKDQGQVIQSLKFYF